MQIRLLAVSGNLPQAMTERERRACDRDDPMPRTGPFDPSPSGDFDVDSG